MTCQLSSVAPAGVHQSGSVYAEKPRAENAGLAEAVYEHRPRKAKWMIKVWWENVQGFSKALAQGTHRQAGAVGILVVETTKWRWTRWVAPGCLVSSQNKIISISLSSAV